MNNLSLRSVTTLFFLFGLLLSSSVLAQGSFSNLRCKNFEFRNGKTLVSDSLTIIFGTVEVEDSLSFQFDYNTDTLQLSDAKVNDTLEVCYRVFPLDLGLKPIYDISEYDSLNPAEPYVFQEESEERVQLFSTPGINKSGALTRGISVGNSSGTFVNSNLNLQLEGEIAPGLNLTGVISDQEIPFQPEGNTQNIQEFDKVYLQLATKRGRLRAGDILLKYQEEGFLRYQRNVQGGLLSGITYSDSNLVARTSLAGAISKGKFSLNIIDAIEGVQGPYRLRGPNGERFIIVLSGSERVYVDGQLLERGWDYDYVIDYNLAEVTFTSKVLITQFSRIRIEFEYADQNYIRTTTAARQQFSSNKLNVDINYYAEKDNPRRPLAVSLDLDDQQYLSTIGDDLDAAFINSFQEANYTTGNVYYRVDTLMDEPFFVFSDNQDSTLYQVIFTEVVSGSGSYVRANTTTTTNIYSYVGQGNGNYVPQRVIALPQLKRMLDIKSDYAISKTSAIHTDVAVSHLDLNQYSEIDDQDNTAGAVHLSYNVKRKKISKSQFLDFTLGGEYVAQNFQQIDRFRPIEFDRNWNADPAIEGANTLLNSAVRLSDSLGNHLGYGITFRDKENDLSGYQHDVSFSRKLSRWGAKSQGFILDADGTNRYSWLRWFNQITYDLSPALQHGVFYNLDKNTVSNNDSVVRTSMYYDELGYFIKYSDTLGKNWSMRYSYREDADTLNGEIAKGRYSNNVSIFAQLPLKNQNLSFTANYRKIEGRFVEQDEIANNLSGQVQWGIRFWQNRIRSNLSYSNVAARELKREFTFQQVPLGQGNYVFQDFNNNGLSELDEFVLEDVFGDYIKVWVPTDEYINAFDSRVVHQLNILFPRQWKKDSSFVKRMLSRLSLQNGINAQQKYTGSELVNRINPFTDGALEEIVSYQRSLKSTLFFNRSNSKFGATGNYQLSDRKQLLNNGFQSRNNQQAEINSRIRIARIFLLQPGLRHQLKTNESNLLINNTYKIKGFRVFNELAFQPGPRFRFSYLNYYESSDNLLGDEEVGIWSHGLEMKLIKAQKYNVSSSIEYLKISTNQPADFNGTAVAYEMMSGLTQGKNYRWQVNLQKSLSNGLQILVAYEGRKPQTKQALHLGKLQVTALF